MRWDVWRMASEDSDQVRFRLPPVHRLDDLCDLDESGVREMTPFLHELEYANELREVLAFGCLKRMIREERDDHVL